MGERMKLSVKALLLIIFIFPVATSWSSGPRAQSLFETGRKHFETGDYYRAVETFSKILQIAEPDTPKIHLVRLARAQAYYGKGDLKKAWADLNTVLESGTIDGETLASSLMLRGTINLSQGRDKKAFEDFSEAIRVDHGNNSLRCLSLTNRGVAFVNKGDLDNALKDLNRAVATDPKSSFARAARGLAYLRADRLDLAKRDSELAMAMNPDPSAAKIAEKILRELSVSQSGPQKLTVSLNDNGQVFVQVRFGRHGTPRRFLVDTGATHTVVSPKLLSEIARETSVVELGKSRVTLADGSIRAVTRYRVKEAFLFHLPLGDIEIHVFDRKTRGGLNLLGTRSLGGVSVSIDNAGRKAEIARK